MTANNIVEQVIPEKELSCDVLVVGMGFTGPVAALRATELGAKVIVIEKQARNWWCPGGIMLIHAELHLDFKPMDAPEKDLEAGLLDCTGGMYPRDLLDATVKNSHRAYKWLQDNGGKFNGIRFDPQGPNRVWGRIKPGGIYDLAHTGVKMLTTSMESKIQQKGGKILYETKALHFLTDVKGAVTGVTARDKDGNFNIKAKSVIMCTGGFGMNNEMMVRYQGPRGDEIVRWLGPWSMGDGFKMCEEVDAGFRSMNHAAYSHYYSADSYWKEDVLGAYVDEPGLQGIIVNRDGMRFVNESMSMRWVGPVMTKVSIDRIGWIIIDQALYENPRIKPKVDDVREFGGTVHEANTLEELAKKAGLGPRLARTVNEYNKAAADGKTAELDVPRTTNVNRITKAPFYAIPFVPGIVTTYGGVTVNPKGQVLDRDGKPIAGLYSAGLQMIGSVCGGTENPKGAYTGFQAENLIFGLLAAENAVKK